MSGESALAHSLAGTSDTRLYNRSSSVCSTTMEDATNRSRT